MTFDEKIKEAGLNGSPWNYHYKRADECKEWVIKYNGIADQNEAYIEKINTIITKLETVKSGLDLSEQEFKNGGFVQGGKTFETENGETIVNCATDIDNIITKLQSAITKAEAIASKNRIKADESQTSADNHYNKATTLYNQYISIRDEYLYGYSNYLY